MVVGELAHERDLIIIGGGPAGYTAAIRAAQLGKEVTLIEKEELGGICLNRGCISSKFFSHLAEKVDELKHISDIGINTNGFSLDYDQSLFYKKTVISNLQRGVASLCRENKIEVVSGSASFLANDRIGVENGDDFEIYTFQKAIISTGSKIMKSHEIKGLNNILDARSLYEFSDIPKDIVINGDDYIAIEAAFSYKSLGSDVYLVISGENFPNLDVSINKELIRQLKKAKIKLYKNLSFASITSIGDRHLAAFKAKGGDKAAIEASHVYIQSALKGNTGNIGLERIGIKMDEQGYILTDKECRTCISHIFACGDVTGGRQLASKAIKQGKTAAEACANKPTEWNDTLIPHVIRSQPPIAYVGLTEQEAISQGYRLNIGQFNAAANGYAGITGNKDGLSKVITDKENDLILGIHLYGRQAPDLIASAAIAVEMAARDEDIKFPVYPHPSSSEGLLEAAESLICQAIHQPPKKEKVSR
ncbi:dihydrolipoyl dehydrogenase family protein [Peribacillus sp. B-H-3]|uniref:dihydrolipoyl dehydrogenase family protein n=1 Tax=Peribacillus sp. B-H-3 TaxID=3400420 RepID=UPI003B0293D4